MKIKIESAWKTLCDAFPKLKDNPLYKGWYISYAILVTLSILTVVVVNHRVVYTFPFDWFGLLFGIILPWLVLHLVIRMNIVIVIVWLRRFLIRNSRNKVSTQQRLHQISLITLEKIMSFILIRKIQLQRYMCSFDLIVLTVKNQFQYSIRA